MSISINGFALEGSLDQVISGIKELRPAVQDMAENNIHQVCSHNIISLAHWLALGKMDIVQEEHKQGVDVFVKDVQATCSSVCLYDLVHHLMHYETKREKHPHLSFDMSYFRGFDLSRFNAMPRAQVFETDGRFYVTCPPFVNPLFEQLSWAKEFSYHSGSDAPDHLSWEQWQARQQTWIGLLGEGDWEDSAACRAITLYLCPSLDTLLLKHEKKPCPSMTPEQHFGILWMFPLRATQDLTATAWIQLASNKQLPQHFVDHGHGHDLAMLERYVAWFTTQPDLSDLSVSEWLACVDNYLMSDHLDHVVSSPAPLKKM